jgi:hypothetical protein
MENAKVSGRRRGRGDDGDWEMEWVVVGGYGHSTGGLNLGGQHFNNRWATGISEATKSRTGTRRIIARSDHQQMITSDPAPSHRLTIPFRPPGIPDSQPTRTFGARYSFVPSPGRWESSTVPDFK